MRFVFLFLLLTSVGCKPEIPAQAEPPVDKQTTPAAVKTTKPVKPVTTINTPVFELKVPVIAGVCATDDDCVESSTDLKTCCFGCLSNAASKSDVAKIKTYCALPGAPSQECPEFRCESLYEVVPKCVEKKCELVKVEEKP